jgi:uncharacterized membrane protein (UPF0182 family)
VTRGQRLAVLIGGIAILLILGRGAAVLHVDHAWYAALDASAIWASKVNNILLLYGGALFIGALFAFVNIFAFRKSIITLTLPTRIGNIEIGETVPPSRLFYVTAAMSVCASAVSLLALPHWTTLALWRSQASFGEIDPYFGLDLSFYITWFPFEIAMYNWAIVMYSIIALLVVTLYALTPSLRWSRQRLYVTTYARRHIGILAGILVAFIAWSIRIDAYRTVIRGNGPDGLFTWFDHQWIVPTNVVVSLVVLGAAIVLAAAIWIGQTQAAFILVSALICALAIVKGIMPWIAHRSASDTSQVKREEPYRETQRLYTARAFPTEPVPLSMQYAADSALLANAPNIGVPGGLRDIVYPGARGVAIESDSTGIIEAPRVGGLVPKLMTAWAEQNPRLLRTDLDHTSALVRHRDVRERVRLLAPIFTQSQSIGVRPTPLGVMWIVDLYTTSDSYPLSIPRTAGSMRMNYRRHAATAYVNGVTGGVAIVPDTNPGPIAKAWFRMHRGSYLTSQSPRGAETPISIPLLDSLQKTVGTDSAFRARITNIYLWMRSTLNDGDFKGFGEAFDSLGAAVGIPR